ncbi:MULTISPECIES: tRNA lysidine(34) synthetase TilS [unclassified Paenibacillus]|uniref:tRNA lysidine(34) synthetase TilS n=1 Tax=unclassified Paenibacillus TaxID=185978 RepID=UPI001C120E54|nr:MULTISPECIES: tRNA lysidine(34) synthetase TilS [unclassified Paenibacillus]MBU5444816.1 tRNA lysidine(34) synthetase TilS [Paenibacillus sp. MSJ-34]CAH0121535.1 tRNA(Ile)-lysidine synthase [Paenibacillus sp. CECT 9249]
MYDSKGYHILQQVQRTAAEHRLWSRGDTIVVAVSGGPDSVALLHVLYDLSNAEGMRFRLVVAHVNHQFRGEESDAEARTVEQLALRLGLPCEMARIDVPAYIEESGMNAQAAAREKRYAFLHETAGRHGAGKIALAHHADDQAETMMMRILRGAGPAGLSGMPIRRIEKNVELIRPFLRIYKTDLIRYCEMNGISYVTDSSNASRKYARNQIRMDVLPFLGQYNQQISLVLNRMAEVIGPENEYLEQETQKLFEDQVVPAGNGYSFHRPGFAKVHVALQRRLIKLILNYLAISADGKDEIAEFSKIENLRFRILQPSPTTWSIDLADRIRCVREYDRIVFVREERMKDGRGEYDYTMPLCGEESTVSIPEHGSSIHSRIYRAGLQDRDSLPRPANRYEAVFDADRVAFPLTVRNRRPGDRMKIIGLNGSKKVQDIFIDDKIAPSVRDSMPIVTDANGTILWIPGVRRSGEATVEAGTSRILYMKLQGRSADR